MFFDSPIFQLKGQLGFSWKKGNAVFSRMSFSRGLKRLCSRVGLTYLSPHKLRNGHGVFGVKAATSIEEFKAFSQNMMHESMEITDRLYGRLAGDDVREVILGFPREGRREHYMEDILKEFKAFLDSKDGL